MNQLNAILYYLNSQGLAWELTPYGSFDYVELVIKEQCVNVAVTKDPRITFELADGDPCKYVLDEVDVPDGLASVSHLEDGWLLLRFDPPLE
jgi:hypothetical protein